MVMMDVLQSVTCCVLALLTLAVFRKELLKVKDAFVSFWIPQKRKKKRDDKMRRESNKENVLTGHRPSSEPHVKSTPPLKPMENGFVTKEMVASETTSKVIEEKTKPAITSDILLNSDPPALKRFEDFASEKLFDTNPPEEKTVDPFPPFSELFQTLKEIQEPLVSGKNSATTSVTKEITKDADSVTKTSVETKHEVSGNSEISFMKKAETVSKTTSRKEDQTDPALESMDLNDLINATQKKLESFTSGWKTEIPVEETVSSVKEITKTETTTKKTVNEMKSSGLFDFLHQPPFSGAISDVKDKTYEVQTERNLDALNGSLGFTSDDSSCITTETPFGTTIVSKKKKMFSSSSFYEEPGSLYPTLEEQVEMARKIADSLGDDTNKKSKGANMFYKRVRRSSNWIHEGPEPSDDSSPSTPEIPGVEPPTPDPSQVPFRPSKGPPKLKLLLDPRHPLDATALRSTGLAINEHNTVSPEVCHGIVKDLQSPVGKGAALFAKRKLKSEEWVVDEEKVKLKTLEKRPLPAPVAPGYNKYSTYSRPDLKLVKTPWEAAMESPLGLCDAAFARVTPDLVANTVIKAADEKRRNSNTPLSREPSRMEGCISPPPLTPAAAHYDIYHAKAPRGWTSTGYSIDSVQSSQAPQALSSSGVQQYPSHQNTCATPVKLAFQNFNTVPRVWRGGGGSF